MPNKKVIIQEEETADKGVVIFQAEFAAPVKFELTTKEDLLKLIADKVKESDKLTIADTNDKAGYENVVKAMGEFKKTRLAYLSAAEENVTAPVKAWLAKYAKDLADIEAALKKAESDLRAKKDFIDNEKVRIKAEEEAAKLRAMQARVNDLNVLGAMFDGVCYTFPYSEVLMATAVDIKEFTDDKFGEFLEEVKTAFSDEQTRIHEAKVRADELQQEQQAEAERVRLHSIAMVEKEKELYRLLNKIRTTELKLLGGILQANDTWLFPDKPGVMVGNLSNWQEEDTKWDELMAYIKAWQPEPEPEAIVEVGEYPISVPGQYNYVPGFSNPLPVEETYSPDHLISKSNTLSDNIESIFDELVEDVQNFLGEDTENVVLKFDIDHQYTDVAITPKRIMRFVPDAYFKTATAGVETLTSGKLQELNWIIFNK